jgi:serine/threonine protein kinase
LEDRTVIQLSSPGSLLRGVRLNGMYEIEALLAQGGMGEVYRGFNIQTRDPVAIKVILPELARNADAFALFRREASTLHNLQHEAIVRYFVFSVDPDLQRAYLAMEFVDGPSLTKRIAQGPLSLEEVSILRKRIAGALEAAHRVGVIHRDISSDNIILPGNDPRRAKIIDFGIARSQRPGEGTLIGGAFAGKYNYVAPEQLGLAGGEVTAKSDIYSFGLVLAEALLGRPLDMNGTQVEVVEKRRSVPALSGIEPSMRPLLQAMLQPLPENRPESMAVVAAWGESEKPRPNRTLPASRNRGPKEGGRLASQERSSPLARIAAIFSIFVLIGCIGGALYLFKDLVPWTDFAGIPSSPAAAPDVQHSANAPPIAPPISSATPTHKPPPLPDMAAGQTIVTAAPPAVSAQKPSVADAGSPSASAPAPSHSTPHVPTADEIVEASKAAALHISGGGGQPAGESAPSPVNLAEPSVAQPSAVQKMSELAQASPSPPPAHPTPQAPQSLVSLDDAIVGTDYVADIPPFSDVGGVNSLVLRADPGPPEGLVFTDLGSGFSHLSGKPTTPGQYSFEIVATNAVGGTARMAARLVVAAAPQVPAVAPNPIATPTPAASLDPPPANPVVASLSPSDKATAFLRGFDGGACFFARPLAASANAMAIQGIGSDKAAFQRFYGAFIRETGAEPTLNVRLISASECPAVDLIRAGGLDRPDGPKIDLSGYDVGRGKPLSGAVSNLAGRHLDLLLVSNDGNVYRLDSRTLSGGGSASFNVPITPDITSIGALQLLLAVVAPKPVHALEGFKAGAAKEILPRLRSEMPSAAASLEVEFFKLVE